MKFLSWVVLDGVRGLIPVPVTATPASKAVMTRHYDRFLGRRLSSAELALCREPTDSRHRREQPVLFNHHDFLTIR